MSLNEYSRINSPEMLLRSHIPDYTNEENAIKILDIVGDSLINISINLLQSHLSNHYTYQYDIGF